LSESNDLKLYPSKTEYQPTFISLLMRKILFVTMTAVAIAVIVFALGPKTSVPQLDATPMVLDKDLHELDAFIAEKESRHPSLKAGNEAGIVWAGDSVHRSEYALVFLHGFTASKMEGRPVTTAIAERFGMNLFEARLYGHGLDTADVLLDLTPERHLRTALEAVAIGKLIGRKVIVASSSTGGTLALYMAAHDPEIAALLCYSPNVQIYDPTARVLTMPWGLQIARLVTGGDWRSYDADEDFKRYWQTRYRLEGVQAVQALVEATMTAATFSGVRQPVLVGCYYKDDVEQDKVVSVEAMREMMPQLGTPAGLQRLVEFPGAGAHVLTSPYRSADVEGVKTATERFLMEVVGL
jgi:pimeloyl-ACP methyl ester carboxylesterase